MQKEKKDRNFIKKPIYPGGIAAMRAFISENLKYPGPALEKKIQGTVSLKYTINHLGRVTDTHIVAGLGYGCDEEAQRVVRLFRFDVPKSRGVKVTFHKDIHVHFRLPRQKPKQAVTSVQYNYTSSPSATPQKGYNYTLTINPPSDGKTGNNSSE